MAANAPVVSREDIAEEIVAREQAYVSRRYGDVRQRGRQPLKYHNGPHTAGSVENVTQIGRLLVASGQITEWDLSLLRIAAAFHDHEQGREGNENVLASADAAEAVMRRYPGVFTESDIRKVRAGILSTRTMFVDNMVVQILESDDVFCKAVADADLAHLGQPTAVKSSLDLNEELQRSAGRSRLDRGITIAFLEFSERFVGGHRFHLPESRKLFPLQRENQRRLSRLVEGYKKRVLSYRQLQQRASKVTAGAALA